MRSYRPLPHLLLTASLLLPMPVKGQQKPFTQDQIVNMVNAGLGDDSGAKLVQERKIDFSPSEEFLAKLRGAGASDAFLAAVQPNAPAGPTPADSALVANAPLTEVQIFSLLVGQVAPHRVSILVQERGINFDPTDNYLKEIRVAGGDDEVVAALKSARVVKPVTTNPVEEVRHAKVREHAARGAQFFHEKNYAAAETEYQAAVELEPQNADLR